MRRAVLASAVAALSVLNGVSACDYHGVEPCEIDRQQEHAHVVHENRVGKDWNYVSARTLSQAPCIPLRDACTAAVHTGGNYSRWIGCRSRAHTFLQPRYHNRRLLQC